MSRVVVFLADGFEEVEAVTVIDYLRRAGVKVVTTGIGTPMPTGARGIRIASDIEIEALDEMPDGIVLPGGMPGSANLAASGKVGDIAHSVMKNENMVAAICAAPALALGGFGLLKNRKYTCFPGFEKSLTEGEFLNERVVVDHNLITSQGAGTAGEFAIAIIRYLVGDAAAEAIAQGVLL